MTVREHSTSGNLLAVIGDIQGEVDRLPLLLDDLAGLGVSRLYAVGDVAPVAALPDAISTLARYGVTTIRGNHDRWALSGSSGELATGASAERLRTLPASVWLPPVAGRDVLICHGLGDDDMNRIGPDDYGYALEANDALQELLARRRPVLALTGHRHEVADFTVGAVRVIDVGSVQPDVAFAAVVLDAASGELWRVAVGGRTAPLVGVGS